MKAFIWSETLDSGAYHEDGSAVVVAQDVEQARELLVQFDVNADLGYTSYHYGAAAAGKEPDFILDVIETEQPRVVCVEPGCDC